MPNPKVRTLTIGGVTYDLQDNISGYITGITSSDVTTALGFTPYNATNPNGYTSNTGTITSVKTTAGTHTTINVSSGAANFNVPTKTSHLTNDSGFLTSFTETDPTVPSWAKAQTKPSYNFSEIDSTPTTLSGYGITNAYTKTEVDGLVSSVLHYKGTKVNYAALPSSGNVTGDVWHLTDTGAEWAWDGSTWQELGTAVDLSGYLQTGDIASWAKQSSKPSYALSELTGATDVQAIEGLTGTSGFLKKTAANAWTLDTNTYLTSYTETDPTVPSWAKQSSKPTYTAAEVGALPDTTTIPSKTSDLTNDSGFITSYTDEKVTVNEVTSGSTYSLLMGFSNSSTSTRQLDSDGLNYTGTNGTTSSIGSALLTLGNGKSSTTDKNKQGKIKLFGTGIFATILEAGSITAGRTITLPNASGTVALTSDIPQVYSSTNTGGYLTMATLPIYDGTVV